MHDDGDGDDGANSVVGLTSPPPGLAPPPPPPPVFVRLFPYWLPCLPTAGRLVPPCRSRPAEMEANGSAVVPRGWACSSSLGSLSIAVICAPAADTAERTAATAYNPERVSDINTHTYERICGKVSGGNMV